MADTLMSAPSAVLRSSVARTRWRRRALSARRPSSMGWAGLLGAALGTPVCSLVTVRVFTRWPPARSKRGCHRGRWGGSGGGQAERNGVGGAVAADHGDGVVDLGSFDGVESGDVTVDAVDQLSDPGDLLGAGGGVGSGPLVDPVDGGGEPFAGAQQVVEVGGQLGQV